MRKLTKFNLPVFRQKACPAIKRNFKLNPAPSGIQSFYANVKFEGFVCLSRNVWRSVACDDTKIGVVAD